MAGFAPGPEVALHEFARLSTVGWQTVAIRARDPRLTDAQDPLLQSTPGAHGADGIEGTVELIARARSGDRAATDALFAHYADRIRRIVRVRLGPALRAWTESGDLVQETLLAALCDLPRTQIRSEYELLDWLAGIATNRVRELADYLRAQKREVARVRPLGVEQLTAATSRSSPSEQAFRAEIRAILDEALAELPSDYREVVLLRDYLGAAWPEIARALSTPTVHAAQQLHQRAWLKVRRRAAPKLAGLEPG